MSLYIAVTITLVLQNLQEHPHPKVGKKPEKALS